MGKDVNPDWMILYVAFRLCKALTQSFQAQSLSFCGTICVYNGGMTDTLNQNDQNRPVDEFEDDFDPDLDISKSRDRVWLVKLPKWLMDHWSKTEQDNVELARINIP